MSRWDPTQYERYSDHRMRPAIDLISRIRTTPDEIWDLGCGTGRTTALLAERWPEASIHGLDSSPEMLAEARQIAGIDWVLGDIADWSPPHPVALVFSNAALQWLGDHRRLLPRLAKRVASGGVLAIQMPRNFDEPSHELLAQTAGSPPWRDVVGHLVRSAPVADPARYHRLLQGRFMTIDIWETEYLHTLEGPDPVAEWARGTALRPYLDVLGGDADAFVADYSARLRAAYRPEPNGSTLLRFRRLFIVGVRSPR